MRFFRSRILLRHRPKTLARLLLVALVALFVAACGSSSSTASGSGSAAAGNGTARQTSSRLKFTQCLRQHGVNIPDQPGAGGPPAGAPQSALQAAGTACRKYAGGAFGNISSAQRTQFQAAFVKYTACLRAHGINVPDPTFGAGGAANQGGGFRQSLQQAQRSPNFQAANRQCNSVLPAQLRNRAGGAGPGG